ncbi:MAG: hypothetical protein R3Y51_02080, partial [Rikenellaceae bacterium]
TIIVKTEAAQNLLDLTKNRFAIIGDSGIRYTYNNGNIAADPLLASTNFLNALDKMPSLKERYEKDNEKQLADIPILQEVISSTWRKEDELKEVKNELAALDRKIQLSLKPIGSGEDNVETVAAKTVDIVDADAIDITDRNDNQSITTSNNIHIPIAPQEPSAHRITDNYNEPPTTIAATSGATKAYKL